MRFCTDCGEKLSDKDKYCSNCGAVVPGAGQEQQVAWQQQAPGPQAAPASPTPPPYPPYPGQPAWAPGGQPPPPRKRMSKGVLALIIVASVVGVFVIAGAVIGVALGVYTNTKDEAGQTVCRANLRTIDGAVQMYYAENEKYPTSIRQLVPDFLKRVPKCPSGDKPYQLKGNPPEAHCPNVASHNF